VTDRIDKKEIRVDKFERAYLADNFAINSDIEVINIEITAIKFKLSLISTVFAEINKEQLQSVMQQAIANIFDDNLITQNLPRFTVGQNLNYAQFKVNLLVLIREKVRVISRQNILNLIATSVAEREHITDLTINYLRDSDYSIVELNLLSQNLTLPTGDILIRAIERAQISPISKDKISVEIDIPAVTTIPQPDVTQLVNKGEEIKERIPPR
jgi:hypothetical protein